MRRAREAQDKGAMDVQGSSMPETPPPSVSVVIRNFNRQDRLQRAFDSVLAQNFKDFHILFVDDHSTDDSVAFVERRYGHLPNLTIIQHPENRGAAAAANTGVEKARGRYVAFLDSDDAWLPDFLAVHVRALWGRARSVMSFCDYFQVWEDFNLERLQRCRFDFQQRRGMLLGGFVHSMSLTLLLRDAIQMAGGFDERYKVSHDFDLWLRLALMIDHPFVYVQRPLVRHYISADGVTADFDGWYDEYRTVLRNGFQHPNAEPFEDLKPAAESRIAVGLVARKKAVEFLRAPPELTVSVILRTGGGLERLKQAVSSVDAQTHRNFEIVVVDTGSADGVLEWLQGLDREDLKVVPLGGGQGQSPAAALNQGAFAAEGELLAFLEDDDEWLPDYLKAQVRANSFPAQEPVFTFTDYFIRRRNGQGDKAAPRLIRTAMDLNSSDLIHQALIDPFPHTLSCMVTRRRFFLDVGGVDESLPAAEDLDLVLKLLGMGCDPGLASVSFRSAAHVTEGLVVRRLAGHPLSAPEVDPGYAAAAGQVLDKFFRSEAGSNYRFQAPSVASALGIPYKGTAGGPTGEVS